MASRENFHAEETEERCETVPRFEAYEGMIRVLFREKEKDFAKEALHYAELAKARLFHEMIFTRKAKGKNPVDREILNKDREFQQSIAKLRDQAGKSKDARSKLSKTIDEYETFIKEVKLQNTELGDLVSEDMPAIDEILKSLPADMSVLEYFIGEEKSYAWRISGKQIEMYELPAGREEIARRVDALISDDMEDESGRGKVTSEDENQTRFPVESKKLYDLILGPVEKNKGNSNVKKLVVIPHGELHNVPFPALYDGSQYLVERYEISVMPSLRTLPFAIGKRNTDTGKLLAFGNPAPENSRYDDLPSAEKEVKVIAETFSEKNVLILDEATETKAKTEAHKPDVIHFACHGEFNSEYPFQSGLILVPGQGEDGILQVHEVFELDIKNANLVTLSACDTAAGKITGGDDVVGFSRAFIYAGTPSVLVSLWELDDKSTRILMEHFYKNWRILKMDKASALRKAQLTLKADPEYRIPYHWAAVELIGDWE